MTCSFSYGILTFNVCMYVKTYTNTYMYVIAIDEKRGHEVGEEQ